MAQWHLRSNRTPSGALRNRIRKKKRRDWGTEFLQTVVDERAAKPQKSWGGFLKVKLLSENKANILDPSTKKIAPTKILSVVENPANPFYIRRNILTKGAVIKTEAGLARITSRPCQDGVVNGVLIKQK